MADFAAAARDDWLALVRRTLPGGADPATLIRRTADGLTLEPLYAPDNSPAPAALDLPPRDRERPWDLRTLITHPDPARANTEALADLEGGAASLILRIDPTGRDGVAIGSAAILARALDGVILELAPVCLDAGFLGPIAADWLAAAAKASPAALLNFNLDPLSAFAADGASPGPIEAHLIAAANTGARLSHAYPKAQFFLASGCVAHEAGLGAAAELGFAAAATLAYAKALVRAGLGLDEAFARITLAFAADARPFRTIAKLRAARLIWARMMQACGAKGVPARIEARSSTRMLADRDVWTNMLRLTLASFGAGMGGADAVVLGAFTDRVGLPTPFGRRQARNAQLVLMEEAHVGAVADPARGAGFVESLTDQFARAGWAAFQAIEAEDGLIRALESGHIAAQPRSSDDGPVVGVTRFPPPEETPAAVETVDPAAFAVDAPSPRLPGPDSLCPALQP